MIRPNELRVGNHLIKINSDEPDIVNAYIIEWCKNDEKYFNSEYKPIPITSELLLKNAFRLDRLKNVLYRPDDTYFLELIEMKDGWYPIYCQEPEFLHESTNRVSLMRINYVHELENLWFALRQTEINLIF